MSSEEEVEITFEVQPFPDSTGLRIKTTSPTGLYLSSMDGEAARWHFETKIVSFVMHRKLLREAPGYTLKAGIDWSAATECGNGIVIVSTVTKKEVTEIKRDGSLILKPPVKELTDDWWTHPEIGDICMVRDPGDMVDGWLLDAVVADTEAGTARKQ